MRRLLLALPLALLAGGTAARAQEINLAEQRIDLAATAIPACVFAAPAATAATNATFAATGPQSGQIAIARLVDATSATSLASSVQLDLPLVCNASHRIVVRSQNGGLLRSGAGTNQRGGNGFGEFVPYRIALAWAGQTMDRSSDSGEGQLVAPRPATGSAEIRVVTPQGQGPLVAGQYSDSIIVEFQPAN